MLLSGTVLVHAADFLYIECALIERVIEVKPKHGCIRYVSAKCMFVSSHSTNLCIHIHLTTCNYVRCFSQGYI